MRTTQAIVAALPMLAAARIGHAEDSRSDARAHYARGLELGAQNGYGGALREFNQAYAISPQFAVLYNIGQAHIALGHPAKAIEALSQYLRDGGALVPPARRSQVQVQIAVLRSQLPNPDLPPEAEAARAAAAAAGAAAGEAVASAAQSAPSYVARPGMLSVRCPEQGLKLLLDGNPVEPLASARGIPVSAGVHKLAFAIPGRRATEQSLDIPAGVAAIVICADLSPATATERPRLSLDGPPVFSEAALNVPTQTVHASTVGYVLGGFGIALTATALGLYVWNRGQYEDAQAERSRLPDPSASNYNDQAVQFNAHVDAIQRTSILTVGLAVAGVGLIAGGFYLWRSDRKHGDKAAALKGPRSWAALSPGGVSWSGLW